MPSTIQKKVARIAARVPWMAMSLGLALGARAQEAGPSLSVSAAYTGDLRRNTTGGLGVGDGMAAAKSAPRASERRVDRILSSRPAAARKPAAPAPAPALVARKAAVNDGSEWNEF